MSLVETPCPAVFLQYPEQDALKALSGQFTDAAVKQLPAETFAHIFRQKVYGNYLAPVREALPA